MMDGWYYLSDIMRQMTFSGIRSELKIANDKIWIASTKQKVWEIQLPHFELTQINRHCLLYR